jgi:uncharacterized protein HemX
MVLPLIIGGAVLGASALGLGSYFGLKNQAPDVTNQNSYIQQTQYKTNEIIIGSNSKIGELTIKDKMSMDATTEQKLNQDKGLNPNMLIVAGLAAGAVYLWRRK